MRRYGEPPQAGKRYRHRPGAYAILMRGRQILLTHQAQPWSEFQLPGGGIDLGESPTTALHREVFEETGWSIAAPKKLGAYRRFVFMPDYNILAEKICHIYVARPAICHGPPREAGHTAHWRSPEQALCELANVGDRDFLREFLNMRSHR